MKQSLKRWLHSNYMGFYWFGLKYSVDPKKFTFATLTLPYSQMHCDKVIKRECLNRLLIELKRDIPRIRLIWKAEPQGNGNIHFHLLTDSFIPHQNLLFRWQRAIHKLGYIDWFAHEHNSLNPNCTDIHQVFKVDNITAYVSKYMSKAESRRPICGHSWGRSDVIGKLKSISIVRSSTTDLYLQKIVDSHKCEVKNTDHFQLILAPKMFDVRKLPSFIVDQVESVVKSNLDILNNNCD